MNFLERHSDSHSIEEWKSFAVIDQTHYIVFAPDVNAMFAVSA
jgi:hypothetical protein